MNVRSLRAEYDDNHTLVMSTRPQRSATSSGVVPIARAHRLRGDDAMTPAVVLDLPPAPAPQAPPARASLETTQSSRRRTFEAKTYRRLSIVLAISLAFVLGVAASLSIQMAARPAPIAARTPRDAITRAESLRVADADNMKETKETKEKTPPRHAVTRAPSPSHSSTSASAASAPEIAIAPPELADSDLLSKGLSD